MTHTPGTMFVIKNQHGDFMKKTYDSSNGLWSPDKTKAKTWKTRAGVEAFAARFSEILRLTNNKWQIGEIREALTGVHK